MSTGIKARILLSNIHQDLQGRLAQHLSTKELHLSWAVAKDLAQVLKNSGKPRSIYGIRAIIHDQDDPKFTVDWEFR